MITAKIVYLAVFWLEALLTFVLVRRYGSNYEANPLARWTVKRLGPFALFLYPLLVGTGLAVIAGHIFIILALIAYHGYFLIEHILVFVNRARLNDEKVKAYIFREVENSNSATTYTIIGIITATALVMGMILGYHYFFA